MVFSSLVIQKRLTQTKVYYRSQTIKSSSCKKNLSQMCMLSVQLASTNAFYSMWSLKDLYKFIVTQSFFATTTFLLSLKQVFWKKSVFYLRYLHNNIAMLLIPKVQHKASTSKIFLTVFFIDNVFLHSIISWVFHIFHSKFSMLIKGYNQIFIWRVFVFTNCFYKLRAKSQSIWHLYKQCLYQIIKFVKRTFYKKQKK